MRGTPFLKNRQNTDNTVVVGLVTEIIDKRLTYFNLYYHSHVT